VATETGLGRARVRAGGLGRRQNGSVDLFTDWHTPAAAANGLRGRLPAATASRVLEAIEFARRAHGDQQRPTGVPYLEHLLEALQVLVEGAGVTDPDVLIAAVLHDVLEDTDVAADAVASHFGARVAELVEWVTIPAARPGEDRAEVKAAALRRLAGAPRDAVLVKLADRVSNVQALRNLGLAKQRSYYQQTVTCIVPLAAADPWFARWYSDWQAAHADLADDPAVA
jgi:(p)ppGpp synthase/HD superfamily hydrolase